MRIDCEIISVTADPFQSWRTVGTSRAEAERYYIRALTEGNFHRPVYRVIACRKSPPASDEAAA